jgi:ribosomal protein S27AE
MSQIKFTLKCPQCGSTKFKASTPKPGPGDTVTCIQCGSSIDLATEKKRLEDEARAAAEERLRNQQ